MMIVVLVTYNFYNFNIQLTKLFVWLSEIGKWHAYEKKKKKWNWHNTYDAVFSAEVKTK